VQQTPHAVGFIATFWYYEDACTSAAAGNCLERARLGPALRASKKYGAPLPFQYPLTDRLATVESDLRPSICTSLILFGRLSVRRPREHSGAISVPISLIGSLLSYISPTIKINHSASTTLWRSVTYPRLPLDCPLPIHGNSFSLPLHPLWHRQVVPPKTAPSSTLLPLTYRNTVSRPKWYTMCSLKGVMV
jgi:hypothetical protein